MGLVWRVELLGGLRARSSFGEISRFRTRRVGMLLAFLALHVGRSFSRDELAELLWPDTEEEVGRRNLRQALHSLRKVLEPPAVPAGSVIVGGASMVGLNHETVTTDVQEMERLVVSARQAQEERLAQWKGALELYRGDLLPGMDELWTLNERFRLEDLSLSCLKGAVDESLAAGELDEALSWLRTAVTREPFNQAWHLGLMKVYLDLNRAASAVKQFEELEELLSRELGGAPDAELIQMAARARALVGGTGAPGERQSTELQEPMASETASSLVSESRLPVQMTRFFGREGERRAVTSLITDGARLVTITGPAGTGKTRLSVEAGRVLIGEGWRAWFVSLAETPEPGQIVDQILDVVRPRWSSGSAYERLRQSMGEQRAVIVLDNFEHLVEEGTAAVAALLEEVPTARFLVTSRHSLGIEGERLFPLSPLATPDWGVELAVETREQLAELASFPSVQLLVDRFQSIRPDVQITLHNARHFVRICQKLEGVPLALEIAAGLSKTLTPGQIVKQLENRLLALTSRRRDISPRHRSLRAAIDYGFVALPDDLKAFFAALSVFRGGFTVEGARKVCFQGSPSGTGACLEALMELQDRSFLQSDDSGPDGSPLRFRMLETFREFGEEQLSPVRSVDLHARHAHYYLSLCAGGEAVKDPATRAALGAVIEADYANYLSAAEWFYERRDAGSLIRLLEGLTAAWDTRGTRGAEEALIRRTVQLPETREVSAKDRVQLLRLLATTYLRRSEYQAAYEACKMALDVAQESGKEELVAACYFGMSLCAGHLGDTDRCIELCEQVLVHARQSDSVLLERTYVSIGSAHWSRDRLEEAAVAFDEARKVSELSRGGEADPLIVAHMAGLAIDRGRLDEGMALANEALRVSRRRGNRIAWVSSLYEVGRYHLAKGSLSAALATSREALKLVRDVAIASKMLQVVWGHAMVLAAMGEFGRSVTLVAASRGIDPLAKDSEKRETERVLAEARDVLGVEAFESAWARGLAMSGEEALAAAIRDGF